ARPPPPPPPPVMPRAHIEPPDSAPGAAAAGAGPEMAGGATCGARRCGSGPAVLLLSPDPHADKAESPIASARFARRAVTRP
ncbi:MAG: hypothetical protein J0L92_00640, partial [Deltaproteobacteria bacterium]|nr:hypothetical protein [Deltaproteobacteria bacterium]